VAGLVPPEIAMIIFDCDGVLADSEVISAQILVGALAEYGVALDERYVFRHYVGQSFPKVSAKIRTTFDIALPSDFESQYRARLLAAFEARLQPMQGIALVLEQLGHPRCVATSSSPPRVAKTLKLCNLARFFGGDVFTASEVANGKPAPDLFLHAARHMRVAPSQCLVIEDSMAGILAAKAAGMAVWRYTGGGHMAGFSEAELETPPDVPAFDNWDQFFQMAPQVKRKEP